MNFFQSYIHPQQKERLLFLGYWIGSLIIWSFAMNVSLVIVIVFSIIGNFVVVRPLAKIFFLLKNFVKSSYTKISDLLTWIYEGFSKIWNTTKNMTAAKYYKKKNQKYNFVLSNCLPQSL